MNTPSTINWGRYLTSAMLACTFAIVVAPSSSQAGTEPPFQIDGNVPDVGCPGSTNPDPLSACIQLADPHGSDKELGASNSSDTKLGVIHSAEPPMLNFTNPNSSTDIVNVWLETQKDTDGDIWLYFAWQRDANTGSSVISYEFQQSQLDPACDYALTDQVEPITADESALIASCNPWSGRQADDFVIVWDFGGGLTDIVLRTFDGNGFDAGTLVTDPSFGYAFAALNGDTSRGEGAINLSDSIFAGLPDSCLSVANIIPGTITGNSDQADYKDTLLRDMSSGISISNCGKVTVTKTTEPGQQQGPFVYTLTQAEGNLRYAADVAPPCTNQACTDTLTGDGDSHTISNLIPDLDYQLTEDLSAATNYLLKSIVCDGQDVTDPGDMFPVTAAGTTNCTITNELATGTVTVIKKVVNIIPGSASSDDFCLSLDEGQTQFSGSDEPGSTFTLIAGDTYTVSEVACGNPDTSPQGYVATYLGACSDTITAFENKTCTVTNTQQEQSTVGLKLFKSLIKNNGGSAATSDWSLSATLKSGAPLTCGAAGFSGTDDGQGTGVAGSVSVSDSLATCVYELAESGGPSGYTAQGWSCTGDHSLQNGNELRVTGSTPVTCTITNDDDVPSLTLVKAMTKNNGGTAVESDWTLSASGPTSISGAGGATSDGTFSAGTYTLSESGGPAGYTATGWSCTNGITVSAGSQITLGLGQSTTCTITNDDDAPSLTLVKSLTKDNGGTAAESDWTLSASGPTPISGAGGATSDDTFSAGTYTLSESDGPAGYTASAWNCDGGSQNGNQITLSEGESATCTISNDDDAPRLTLVKALTKNNGGSAVESDWTLRASGPTPISGAGGATSDDTFSAGTYTLSESDGPAGYSASAWSCTDGVNVDSDGQITLGLGQSTTCTITNDDNPPSLTLVKQVITDNGGSALATSWTLNASGPTPISGAGGATSDGAFSVGTYTLSESGGPAGYTASSWNCVGGSQIGNQITLTEGESATCTIANNDVPPSLTLVKQLINDNGGSAVETDWSLSASGPVTISGAGGVSSDASFRVGTYTLSESGGPAGYSASAWSCFGGAQSGNQITLTEGQSATCTIVNNDIQPTLTLVKTVVNDDHPEGLGLQASDFPLSIADTGGDPISASSGVPVPLNAGSYVASETNQPGYAAGNWGGDCSSDGAVSLGVGDAKTCTITNNDIPPELKVIKTPDVEDGVKIRPGEDAVFFISVSNIGGGDAYGVTLTDTLPSPAEGLTGLTWYTATPGCTITNGINLSCDVGFLGMDPTPAARESGDESSFSAAVIARIPPDYLFTTGQPGGAGTLGSNFEIDGNMALDGGNPPLVDWGNAQTVAASSDGFFANVLDPPANSLSPYYETDNSFGEGTKEDDTVPVVLDHSVPPNKSDLTNFLVTQDIVDGNLYLVLGWLRANSLGTSNFDFELNQSRSLSANGATPERMDGDVLISFDFEGSGDDLDSLALTLREWDAAASAWGPPRDLNSEGTAYGAVNDPIAFGTDPTSEPNTLTGDMLLNNTFGEAIVNLTKTFAEDCKVFLSAYVKGRSSTSFTSSMKDFVSPMDIEVSSCRTITLPNQAQASAANHDEVFDGGSIDVSNDTDVVGPEPVATPTMALTGIPGATSTFGHVHWSGGVGTYVGGIADAIQGAMGAMVEFQPDSVHCLASIHDLSGDGSPELITLGAWHDGDGRLRLNVRDPMSGAVVNRQFYFSKDWDPLDMAVLPDLGGDGTHDVAVLAEERTSGRIVARIKDGANGTLVQELQFLDPAWRARQMILLDSYDENPGVELGVLATNPEGQISVLVRDATTNAGVKDVRFLNEQWDPIHAVALPDYSGNGVVELGVLARRKDTGDVTIMIRDALTKELVRNLYPLNSGFEPIKAVVMPDQNANGSSEMATLGIKKATGRILVQVRDSLTGQFLRNLSPLGADWQPKDMEFLPDSGNGSPGLSVLATRPTDGRHIVQTIDANSGDLIGNVWLD